MRVHHLLVIPVLFESLFVFISIIFVCFFFLIFNMYLFLSCIIVHSANSREGADSSVPVNHSEEESGIENRRRSAVSDFSYCSVFKLDQSHSTSLLFCVFFTFTKAGYW